MSRQHLFQFGCFAFILSLTISSRQAAADTFHATAAPYSVTLNEGGSDHVGLVGFNGPTSAWVDPTNSLNGQLGAELHRHYVVTFTPDPGWSFTTLGLSTSINAFAGGSGYLAGPFHYDINGTEGDLLGGGGNNFIINVVDNQNTTDNPLAVSGILVPASGFTLTLDTRIATGTVGSPRVNVNNFNATLFTTPSTAAPVPTVLTVGLTIMAGILVLRASRRPAHGVVVG